MKTFRFLSLEQGCWHSVLEGCSPTGFSFHLGSHCLGGQKPRLDFGPPGAGFDPPALQPRSRWWENWAGPLSSAGWWSAMNALPTLTRTTAQTRRLRLSPASPPLQVLVPVTPAVPVQVLSPVSPRVPETQFARMFSSQKRLTAQG